MVVVKGEGCGEGVPFPVDKWISATRRPVINWQVGGADA